MVAHGVHESGRREVIGIEVGEAETEVFWREFLCSLRSRGLSGVRLCVSNGTALFSAWMRAAPWVPRLI